jgi:cell division protease FtsH
VKSPHSGKRLTWQVVVVMAAVFILVNFLIVRSLSPSPRPHARIPYSPLFLDQVTGGNVKEITSKGGTIQGLFKTPVPHDTGRITAFQTEIPAFADTRQLMRDLEIKGVTINAQPLVTAAPWWRTLLFGLGPALLLIMLIVGASRMATRAGHGAGMESMGKSRARRYEASEQRATFADVAGIDEAKAELSEIVDFLRSPEKYRRLGGRIPRGVLLSGPPGTGKTLLARAVAGEADVPFFSMSASEFIEMIVGVGASRVRDLFQQAKEAAPAIIFIDELDAIGRSRSAGVGGFGGGHDEREQTLNQILTEMDGFNPSTGVIVLAATNRPDVLDVALLRAGRFDRRVAVQPPDQAGRSRILQVHTRGVPLGPDVDLDTLASTTVGMVGADLANMVNEAALLAARREHGEVGMSDLSDALERIVLGAERKIMLSAADRERTAYHEAGHAIVGMLTPAADPVRKVSVIPRGVALGVTFSAPEADRFSYDEAYLRARIKVALGGRVAEKLVYGDMTTGAESDIQQLTQVARKMVGRWGMSREIGPVAVLGQDEEGARAVWPATGELSERTRRRIDDEVRRIVDFEQAEATSLLTANRDRLDALAAALLRHETLGEEEVYRVAGIGRGSADAAPHRSCRGDSAKARAHCTVGGLSFP